MSTRSQLARSARRVGVAALLLTSAACHEDVLNLNAPDRNRATQNPSDVEALIGGAFYPTMHTALNTSLSIRHFANAASDFTATLAGSQDQQQYEQINLPRTFHNNGAHISQSVGPHGPRFFWAAIGRVSSVTYDGLQLIDEGMKFIDGTVDNTPRAEAFAKFMQGWAWGYQALIWDESHVLPETTPIPSDPVAVRELAVSTLTEYPEAMDAAIAALEEAIAIAQANPNVVRYPTFSESPLWFGTATPTSNQKFIQMANTLAARLLVLNARTPAERAAVDWQKVLQFTANGLQTEDFTMQLNAQRTSTLLARIQGNTTGGADNARWNYLTIGPADQSGAYQAWLASPLDQRDRFNIVTPDRRLTGLTPTSDGSYTRYRADDNGFLPHRGKQHFSAYQWARHSLKLGLNATTTGSNQGLHTLITADENKLLRAEALLRTGDRAGAAALINVTRTRQQKIGTTTYDGLPPVTAAGVPTVDGQCVPRTDSGACGDLLAALRYERMIELAGFDLFRGYADSRGFGILVDGALIHFPVPGNVLELYGMEEYSYGGVGGPGAAVYAPATLP